MTRVLVVEDSQDSREALQILLELEGHEVRVAASGEDAVRAVTESEPDWALIDLGLPDIDGYETARRIRAASSSAVSGPAPAIARSASSR